MALMILTSELQEATKGLSESALMASILLRIRSVTAASY